MVDESRTVLEAQIAQEALELKNAPVINPIVGQVMRCHICGQCFSANDLKPYDVGLHPQIATRLACPNCHPQRSIG